MQEPSTSRAATARRRARPWIRAIGLAAALLAGAGRPQLAEANPAVDGVRNLALGNVARASSYGSNAALLNPSNMGFAPQLTVEPTYQVGIQRRMHGLGIVAMDSLNNPRISVALGYLFVRGTPEISFFDTDLQADRKFELSSFGHEAFLSIGVMAVKRWLALGITPKYQYLSLRYRDAVGVARDAQRKLNAFGLDISATVNFAGWVAAAITATNLTGNHPPPYTAEQPVRLENVPAQAGSFDHRFLPDLSPYPLQVGHGLAVFPLHNQNFSINFDGTYDFTSYQYDDYVRLTYGGSAEFIVGPVPLRFGTVWDGRGRGGDDDRVYISGGAGYLKPAQVGGVGIDVGVGFRQQVTGPQKDTVLGINIGVRIHPDV